jgi:hypothetical protein
VRIRAFKLNPLAVLAIRWGYAPERDHDLRSRGRLNLRMV